ncbi:MAG: sugar phosphate isomerase/epimerase [Deltaproteobacteria bacterium]|nr:sugar phosphate isomerase/epimerase [Deltaproteobacteria bacterium]MBW2053541.1 sugar phosphate isomerase/epimerase [Deltaproteobacteria bacterium]MBW2142095.1 sugar phosphate isomerase/epimerase [Deltaproteobacteria bacterium]MBW2324638.1 sugar phosphate isomerase/epimerase [Deltaproteobacteria bacterium]
MHIGFSMSCIDHEGNTRSEARQLALQLKEQFGLTSIEIILEGVGRRHAPYPWEYTEEVLRELEDFLEHFPRKGAHLPFYNMNVISVNPRVREDAMEQMRMAIEIAMRLKLDYAVVHATGTTEGLASDREPRRQFLAFSRLARLCEGSSLKLSIENASNLHDIKQCVEMINSLKDEGLPVSMTFDTGHANFPRVSPQDAPYKQFGDMAGALEGCIEHLDNIHLHNNYGSSDQHLGLTDGTIDLKSCIERLRKLNYKGSLSIEVNPRVQDLSKEITTLQKWVDG